MPKLAIGWRVYSLGVVALGLVELRFNSLSADWLPVSTHTPGYTILVYVVAGLLMLAGFAMNAPRARAPGAAALVFVFAAVLMALELPHAVMKPTVWVEWQAIAEIVVMALGGVLAYVGTSDVNESCAAATAQIARLVFGMCLLVFGVSHFVYAKFTASLVPIWLPPSQLTWTYVTGVAQIAAGLAMASGIKARLAAILLTVMYAIFGALAQLPTIIADPSSHDNWAENAVNLILLGAAWSLVDSLSKSKSPRS